MGMATNLVGYLLRLSTSENHLCFYSSKASENNLRLTSGNQHIVHRYGGIFLDEFSDLGPKAEECARILRYVCGGVEAPWMKLVVTGYALEPQHLQSILGDHDLMSVTGRKYILEHCQIDSSGDKDSLLQIATQLTKAS